MIKLMQLVFQEEMDRLKRGLEAVLMNARIDTFEEDMQIEQINIKQLVTEVVSSNKRLFIGSQCFQYFNCRRMYRLLQIQNGYDL